MIEFTVQGKPQPKQRPRFSNGRVYTPTQTKSYEALVGWKCREVYKQPPTDKPVTVALEINLALPKTTKNRIGDWCMKNQDIDNIGKVILDSLNGIAYLDDKQVVELNVTKKWNSSDYVVVKIREVNNDGSS